MAEDGARSFQVDTIWKAGAAIVAGLAGIVAYDIRQQSLDNGRAINDTSRVVNTSLAEITAKMEYISGILATLEQIEIRVRTMEQKEAANDGRMNGLVERLNVQRRELDELNRQARELLLEAYRANRITRIPPPADRDRPGADGLGPP